MFLFVVGVECAIATVLDPDDECMDVAISFGGFIEFGCFSPGEPDVAWAVHFECQHSHDFVVEIYIVIGDHLSVVGDGDAGVFACELDATGVFDSIRRIRECHVYGGVLGECIYSIYAG